jgi:hypothetical protein
LDHILEAFIEYDTLVPFFRLFSEFAKEVQHTSSAPREVISGILRFNSIFARGRKLDGRQSETNFMILYRPPSKRSAVIDLTSDGQFWARIAVFLHIGENH